MTDQNQKQEREVANEFIIQHFADGGFAILPTEEFKDKFDLRFAEDVCHIVNQMLHDQRVAELAVNLFKQKLG